jgi:2-polyprenyl-3-methyl-5-hydroxy-6-metoxy-1,4-benzoquinol methylase
MNTTLDIILYKIKVLNKNHFDKLETNLSLLDDRYRILANSFFDKYKSYLEKNQMTLDFGVNCYLHMIEDMINERYEFIRTGKYSNSSFEDVEKRIYGNHEIMNYHMHGLVLAQFLWFDQYDRILFFVQNINKYIKKNNGKYLEIGGGHGLYMNEAFNLLPEIKQFDLVDISQSSLNLAVGIINNDKINYYLRNVFDFYEDEKYDFITIGEVIEHVEEPVALLKKAAELLTENGVCYITTPINAPMIDHIYLFNNEDEIRGLVKESGFEVIEEKIVISEKMTKEKAAKHKVPVMYAAFLRKSIKL